MKDNTDIIFDGNEPLIKWKSELDFAIEDIDKLNKEIGFSRGFMYGFISNLFLNILIIIICMLLWGI